MKLSLCQFVLFICIFGKKIDCASGCGPKEYYSEDIPGCVYCPVNCDDQDPRDIERCKKACETKTTGAPTFPTTTKVPKSDELTPQSTTTHALSPKVRSTIRPFESNRSFKKTTVYPPKSKHTETANSAHVGLAVSLGVLGTFVVCLVVLVVYIMWRCSRASGEKSGDEEAQIEICGEPSTSSQEPSPAVTKRSQSSQASSVEVIDGIPLPLQETEKLILPETEDSHVSSLILDECEN